MLAGQERRSAHQTRRFWDYQPERGQYSIAFAYRPTTRWATSLFRLPVSRIPTRSELPFRYLLRAYRAREDGKQRCRRPTANRKALLPEKPFRSSLLPAAAQFRHTY